MSAPTLPPRSNKRARRERTSTSVPAQSRTRSVSRTTKPAGIVRRGLHALLELFTHAPDATGSGDNASLQVRRERTATESRGSGSSTVQGRGPSHLRPGSSTRSAEREQDPAVQRHRQRRRRLLRARLRLIGGVIGVAALVVGAYVIPRLSVFEVRQIAVEGASAVPDLVVRRELDRLIADSTVFTLDTGQIERKLEALPFVHHVSLDRRFPGGLLIRISEYEPLALGVTSGSGSWLVARDGRVLAKVQLADWARRIPVVVIERDGLAAGQRLTREPALHLLRIVPPTFPGSFEKIEVFTASRGRAKDRTAVMPTGTETVVGTMTDGLEIRFGRPEQFDTKLAVVERLLALYGPQRRGSITYIDVSVPARPAVMAGATR